MTASSAVVAVRRAVRAGLGELGPGPVMVACSGGADSLALLLAVVREAPRHGWHVIGVTVDHGLQTGSAEHATEVVAQMAAIGAAETAAVRVRVVHDGRGVEAAARQARYAVLTEMADRFAALTVALGHTRDDQAETVVMGLTRGGGGRALAGMRPRFDGFRRPLLTITRKQTEAVCRDEGWAFWSDPHNEDPRYLRARVRHRVMPVLDAELGPGVVDNLARTAEQLREDMGYLDEVAAVELSAARTAPNSLSVAAVEPLPVPIRRRVLREAAVANGAIAAETFRVHVIALEDLLMGPSGRQVQLPGHVHVTKTEGQVVFGVG